MWFLPFAFQIIFLETICNDKDVLERNIRLKVQQSPDYAEQWEITYLLSYAHLIGALLYAIVIFYVTGQILKLVCGISKNDWPIMKRSIITEYIEKIPLMSLQISYIPHIPSQNCLSTVCHLYAKPLVFVPFLTGRCMTDFFIRAILPPSLVFFLLFLSSSMTLTCCCSYPKFKTHVQTQPNCLYLLLPFHPILKPQPNWGQDARFNWRKRPAPMACREK